LHQAIRESPSPEKNELRGEKKERSRAPLREAPSSCSGKEKARQGRLRGREEEGVGRKKRRTVSRPDPYQKKREENAAALRR